MLLINENFYQFALSVPIVAFSHHPFIFPSCICLPINVMVKLSVRRWSMKYDMRVSMKYEFFKNSFQIFENQLEKLEAAKAA